MKKEELEKKLHCGLKVLNIDRGSLSTINFRSKNYEKILNPKWPVLIRFLAEAELESFGIS